MSGKQLSYTLSEENRAGDHIWYVSDVRKFQRAFPKWRYAYDLERTLSEMVAATQERYGTR
jgi:CDP-paratose 2-epimerase